VESECGCSAVNKNISVKLLSLPIPLLERVIDGVLSGDGSFRNNEWRLTTVSRELAQSLCIAVAKVYRVCASIEFTRRPKITMIEGRRVNQRDTYTVSFRKEVKKQSHFYVDSSHVWVPFKCSVISDEADVYNLEVEGDNSYIANNAVVHNCQGFSFAGKQLAFDDPRSALFFEYVRILERCKELNPDVKFMLENVKMKKEYLDIITKILGVEPILINSALVSAQNRKRYYWTNIPSVNQPEDKHVFLADILEPNLPSCGIGARVVGRKLNELGKRDDYNKDIPIRQYLELRSDKKANCMTTVPKDSVVAINKIEGRYKLRSKSKTVRCGGRNSPIGSRHEWDFPCTKTDKKLGVKRNQGKASCLTGGAHSGGNHSDMDILVIEPDICRRYSITEVERLQTILDGYTQNKGVSNSQCYKMLGNGWTVDVIAHIFKGLHNEKQ